MKKIKDLTEEEMNKICKEHKYCHECPLAFTYDCGKSIYCSYYIACREVEVEDAKV